MESAVAKLRAALADPEKLILSPGVYDGFTGRIALGAGFDTLYMTGAGVAMSKLGMPDLGVATLNDMRDTAGLIASLDPSVPVIADADTGYGGPLMVGRTVAQYMRAGVAALHLEDQVQTKRCGHLTNKELVSEEDFTTRIRAAVMARDKEPGDIVIIARTDSLQSLGYEVARDRLKKAVEAGADVAFLEGVVSKEQGKQICADLAPTPCLFNNVQGGLSPDLSVDEAKELGYRIMILPGFALGPVYTSVKRTAEALKKDGRCLAPEKGGSPKELFMVCGLKECMDFDLAAGGKLYSNGV